MDRIDVPEEVLNDLHTHLKPVRRADDIANEGWQYATNTAYLKELVAYWIWEEPQAVITDVRDFFRAVS